MARKRRRFTPEFKARVPLEASHERESVKAIAMPHELHPKQVGTWKRQLLEAVPGVFACGQDRKLIKEYEAKVRKLHAKLGELTVERGVFGPDSVVETGGPDPDDRPGQPDEPLEAMPVTLDGPPTNLSFLGPRRS